MKGLAVSPLSDGTRHKKQENLTTDNTDVTDEEICDPSFIHLFIRVIRCAKTGALYCNPWLISLGCGGYPRWYLSRWNLSFWL